MEHDILEAAKAVVKEVGFSKATIVGVATRSNVHVNAIYNRYGDLEGVFYEV